MKSQEGKEGPVRRAREGSGKCDFSEKSDGQTIVRFCRLTPATHPTQTSLRFRFFNKTKRENISIFSNSH